MSAYRKALDKKMEEIDKEYKALQKKKKDIEKGKCHAALILGEKEVMSMVDSQITACEVVSNLLYEIICEGEKG